MRRPIFSLRLWWPPLLAAALLLGFYFYATAPGLSDTGDSRYYLFAAQSWRESGRLLHPDGTRYRYWPPLFPLLLSWAGTVARLRAVHAACLAGALFFWRAVGRQLLPTCRAAAVLWLLALSTPALVLSKFVWAETVFGLLWAGYVWALLRWRRSGRWADFGLATTLGFLLPLQRSTGAFLLAGVGVALLAERSASTQKTPARPARLLHVLLSLSGALWWQLHVAPLPGPEGAYRSRGWGQLLSSAADYGFVLWRWLLPLGASWRAAQPAGTWAAALVGLLVGLWPRSGRKASLPRQTTGNPSGALSTQTTARLLWAAMAACVLLLLPATVFTRSAAGLQDGERYAAALYPAVVVLVLHRWPAAPDGWLARRLGPAAWRWASRAALAAWLLYAGLRTARNAQQLRHLPPATWLPR